MNTLQAGPLRLEPLTAGHAAEMFEVLSDPALYEFEHAPPASAAWLEQRYRRLETRTSDDGSQQWLNWVLRLPSGALAGYVQATVMQGATAYLAYELASRHWRQGMGRASVQAVMDELALHHGVRTFLAVLKARNFRSKALLHSLGFQDTAPLRSVRADCAPDELVMHKRLAPAPAGR